MNSKTKIVFFLGTLNAGGAERVTINIIRKLNPEEFDITLICVEFKGAFVPLIPKHVKRVDLDAKKTLLSIFKLRAKIAEIEPDIIFSTLFRTHIATTLSLIGLKQQPITIFRSPTSPKTLIERGEMSQMMRSLLTLSYKKAHRILAQTPAMREEIAYFHKVDDKKIDVFLNPLDTELIDDKINEEKSPFDNKYTNIVAAGRVSEVKGFDTLIYALKIVVENNPNFILHIIGRDGGEEAKLKNLVEELNLKKNIIFWGFQENPYLFFNFSDLYVLSSRREGLPNTVLENLYLNKPIVATRCISFMDELIDDKKNGFIVDVEDSKGMANAILNYKELETKGSNYTERLLDVNQFFKKLYKRENI